MLRKLFIFFWIFPLWAQDDLRKDLWETTNYIWNFGLIQSCDKGLKTTPLKYFEQDPPKFDKDAYTDIQKGEVVWVQCRFMRKFYEEVLPLVQNPFVLLISHGAGSFPSNSGLSAIEVEDLLKNDHIIHIFTQNFDYKGNSSKISPIPIGMDFHTIAYKGKNGGWGEKGTPKKQERALNKILAKSLPTSLRIKRAFVDFQLSDTMHAEFNRFLECGEDRTIIFQKLLKTGLIDYANFMPRTQLWKKKVSYAFSISPHGNGLDCHRTWEDLALGCIVIVKTSSLDPVYEGLPVVIVKEWSEITEENLTYWLSLYGDALTNPSYREKLTNAYWIKKIQSKAVGK